MNNQKSKNSKYEECKAKWELHNKKVAVTKNVLSLEHLDDYMKNITCNINSYMKTHNLSILEFSRKTGIDRDTIKNLILGLSETITLKTILGLCMTMGCSADKLIK